MFKAKLSALSARAWLVLTVNGALHIGVDLNITSYPGKTGMFYVVQEIYLPHYCVFWQVHLKFIHKYGLKTKSVLRDSRQKSLFLHCIQ